MRKPVSKSKMPPMKVRMCPGLDLWPLMLRIISLYCRYSRQRFPGMGALIMSSPMRESLSAETGLIQR